MGTIEADGEGEVVVEEVELVDIELVELALAVGRAEKVAVRLVGVSGGAQARGGVDTPLNAVVVGMMEFAARDTAELQRTRDCRSMGFKLIHRREGVTA